MDSNNPFTDGLETTEMVVSRFQDTRIIVLSMDPGSTMAGSSWVAFASHGWYAATLRVELSIGCLTRRPQ